MVGDGYGIRYVGILGMVLEGGKIRMCIVGAWSETLGYPID